MQREYESIIAARQGTHDARSEAIGPWLWRNVPAASVVEFLRDYRTHPRAITVIASRMAEYIESHARDGLLAGWTVALMSAKRPVQVAGTGRAGNLVVQRFQRTALPSSTVEHTQIRRLLSPEDELLDMTTDELAELERLRPDRTRNSQVTAQDARGYDLPGSAVVRIGRPPSRGLLILYPLVVGSKGADLRQNPTAWGIAVSFPRSDRLRDHDFVVNQVWRDQLATD